MDEKDRKLLNLLQEDGRSSLKDLAKKINLSIDATKKRILKLKQQGVFTQFGIFVDPKQIGYDLVVDNKIKLTNITQEKRTKFISYLVEFHLCNFRRLRFYLRSNC